MRSLSTVLLQKGIHLLFQTIWPQNNGTIFMGSCCVSFSSKKTGLFDEIDTGWIHLLNSLERKWSVQVYNCKIYFMKMSPYLSTAGLFVIRSWSVLWWASRVDPPQARFSWHKQLKKNIWLCWEMSSKKTLFTKIWWQSKSVTNSEAEKRWPDWLKVCLKGTK